MSRVLVSVFVPVVNREMDVFIPYEVPLGRTTGLLRNLLGDDPLTGGEAVRSAVLCDRGTGAILNPELSPQEAGLTNASQFLFL
ncbi:MAG: hypothetical protein U1E26_12670 [Coriobacteriia bacterium]|nr:hypothetical protein [Coriobacteriia bacterium]